MATDAESAPATTVTEPAAADDVSADSDSSEADDSADGSGEGSGNEADDGSCIEGDWTVSEAELAGYHAALGESSGVAMTTTGTARLRFIDLQYAYDAMFVLEMDIAGTTATGTADGVALART